MIRVVLDTNIVVSATFRAGGLPEAVFHLAIDGVVQLCVSEPILAEDEEVLSRAWLAIPPAKVANALARIREQSSLVADSVKVDPAACPDDPGDFIFLECAETTAAITWSPGTESTIPTSGRKPAS